MRPVTRIAPPAALAATLALVAATVPAAHASDPVLPLPCDKLAPAPVCLPPVPTSTVRCRDWSVGRLHTPGDRDRLVVSAVCTVRGQERLELRRLEPQGINPADLLLELVLHRAPFPDRPVAREVRVFHVEPDAGYRTVTILPDGPTLPVDELGSA
jgi:hypothetical protein